MKIEYEKLADGGYYITCLVLKNDKGEQVKLTFVAPAVGFRKAGEILVEAPDVLSPAMNQLIRRLEQHKWDGWSSVVLENEIALAETYEVAKAVEKATQPDYHDGRMESLETEVRALKGLLTGLIAGITDNPEDVEDMMRRKWRLNDED